MAPLWHLFCMDMFLSFFLLFLLSWSLRIFWKAHLGYLHCVRAPSRCFNSSFSSWELEQTAFALCVRVSITLYLQARLWWLSHCRYWSIWVGFLYTFDVNVPSSWGVTRMSKKGMELSCFCSSVVNCMAGSTEFICCRNSHSCLASIWQMCHPQIFSTIWVGSLLLIMPYLQRTPYIN